jgi:solute carrier family 29 (equilibrative nucleoside transporter), member 1/2/3
VAPGLFFAFVLLNGVGQAALGSYLQTSVIAVASLFGPSAIQAMFSGQACVAIVISAVQLISAVGAVWAGSASTEDVEEDEKAAERSAFIFFGLSTVFLWSCVMLQRWLMGMPAYREVARGLEKAGRAPESPEEARRLMGSPPVHSREPSSGSAVFEKNRVFHVAKANVIYEVAVAYVFLVTLVNTPSCDLFD